MAIDWSDFFEFSQDTTFDIVEEDGLIQGGIDLKLGDGKVLELDGNKLVLELNITSQTISALGNSVDVPRITGTASITILNLGVGNRLEATGTYIDANGVTQSFSYQDINLRARLRSSGNRLSLNASDAFLDTISDSGIVRSLGRLEFEKTGDSNTTEMDIGDLPIPFNNKIDVFFERN